MGILLALLFAGLGVAFVGGILITERGDDEAGSIGVIGFVGGVVSVVQLISAGVGDPGTMIPSLLPWGALVAWLGGAAIIPGIWGIEWLIKREVARRGKEAEAKRRSKQAILARMDAHIMDAARVLEGRGLSSFALIEAGQRMTYLVGRIFDDMEVRIRHGGITNTDSKALVAEADSLFEADSSKAGKLIAARLEADLKKGNEWRLRAEQAIELAVLHCSSLASAATVADSTGGEAVSNIGLELGALPSVVATTPGSGLISQFEAGAIENEILSIVGMAKPTDATVDAAVGIPTAQHEHPSSSTGRGRRQKT